MSEAWASLFRIVVGVFWLYYASEKWRGVGWVQSVMKETARGNPIPGLPEVLAQVVAPNWLLFAVAQGAGQTVVAVLLILGLATRWAGVLAFLLALNLALTVAF